MLQAMDCYVHISPSGSNPSGKVCFPTRVWWCARVEQQVSWLTECRLMFKFLHYYRPNWQILSVILSSLVILIPFQPYSNFSIILTPNPSPFRHMFRTPPSSSKILKIALIPTFPPTITIRLDSFFLIWTSLYTILCLQYTVNWSHVPLPTY